MLTWHEYKQRLKSISTEAWYFSKRFRQNDQNATVTAGKTSATGLIINIKDFESACQWFGMTSDLISDAVSRFWWRPVAKKFR